MKEKDQSPFNLHRFQKHQREIPWALIRKIVVVTILGGLIYYMINDSNSIQPVQQSTTEFEIEIE